jgi:hypothetical protein
MVGAPSEKPLRTAHPDYGIMDVSCRGHDAPAPCLSMARCGTLRRAPVSAAVVQLKVQICDPNGGGVGFYAYRTGRKAARGQLTAPAGLTLALHAPSSCLTIGAT